jgi:hypothetical protein
MSGGGAGADLFACNDAEVRRIWATSYGINGGSGDVVTGGVCTFTNGQTTMTFTRALATANSNQLAITLGTAQAVVFAHGSGRTLSYHGPTRGAALIDFGDADVVATPSPPTTPAPTNMPANGAVATVTDLNLGEGVSLDFQPAGDGAARFTVRRGSDAWLAFGFAQGDAVSMTSGGRGSDVFVCTVGEVRRYWVTSFSLPGSGVVVPDSECNQVNGRTEMTFTRTLAAGSQENAITQGVSQAIYAFGTPGQTAVAQHTGTNRGGASINYFEGGVTESKLKAPAQLYLHLAFMVTSWGGLLPLGATAARLLRNTPGQSQGPPKAWFVLHRGLQSLGWLLQLLGFGFAIWFVQENGTHFISAHANLGLVVVVLGTLQPLNALVRPHATPEGEKKSTGRLVFEVVHKGLGWVAVACGFVNCILGIVLLNNRRYETVTVAVAAALTALCILPALTLLTTSVFGPDNPVARALLGVKKSAVENGQDCNAQTV